MTENATLSHLARLCSLREYSSKAIFTKALKAIDGDEAAASRVLSRLQQEGYQSDSRYASAYCRDKALLSGWGPAKIRSYLAREGIAPDLISQALEELDPSKTEDKALKVLQAKARSLKDEDPRKRHEKLFRFALSRGFDYDFALRISEELTR